MSTLSNLWQGGINSASWGSTSPSWTKEKLASRFPPCSQMDPNSIWQTIGHNLLEKNQAVAREIIQPGSTARHSCCRCSIYTHMWPSISFAMMSSSRVTKLAHWREGSGRKAIVSVQQTIQLSLQTKSNRPRWPDKVVVFITNVKSTNVLAPSLFCEGFIFCWNGKQLIAKPI